MEPFDEIVKYGMRVLCIATIFSFGLGFIVGLTIGLVIS